ncbi:MAG TPA: PilZ domain-containing protein [Terriglobales bacterium]|nr:PilZ domain-containing protein [Terriglobales bacterium]
MTPDITSAKVPAKDYPVDELRSSVRFPLKLPVELRAEPSGVTGQTEDISAGGVLFYMDAALEIGSIIDFAISMPASVLGTATDVIVKCTGRVVRCSKHGDRTAVAAVIDEYHFDRTQ